MNLDESAGPLAEFGALRNEIDSLWKAQMQFFTLQLTIAGASFSFVLSHSGYTALLLVVPVVSYLLAARYFNLEISILLIGRYIKDDLSDRIPGGLRWEAWWRAQDRTREGIQGWAAPLWVTFPGAAVLALAWSAVAFTIQRPPMPTSAGLVVVWLTEILLTVACVRLIRGVYMAVYRPASTGATP